jgi:hypothetical protein
MAFTVTDQHITEHCRDGATVLRGIIPLTLINDLRVESDKCVGSVREDAGQQIQRYGISDKLNINLQPFTDFSELTDLNEALQTILGDDTFVKLMSVLINPGKAPYCTHWHRDTQVFTKHAGFHGDIAKEFERIVVDVKFMNQFNCPLYSDKSTWVVPGSQLRVTDTQGEIDAAESHADLFPENIENEITSVALEERGHRYCQTMPGAVQLILEPGDFALYRPHGWHIGNYVHYSKRATLHGLPTSQAEVSWRSDYTERLNAAAE